MDQPPTVHPAESVLYDAQRHRPDDDAGPEVCWASVDGSWLACGEPATTDVGLCDGCAADIARRTADERHTEADDTRMLTFRSDAGNAPYVADAWSQPPTHQLSRRLLATYRDLAERSGLSALAEAVRVGDRITAPGPFGQQTQTVQVVRVDGSGFAIGDTFAVAPESISYDAGLTWQEVSGDDDARCFGYSAADVPAGDGGGEPVYSWNAQPTHRANVHNGTVYIAPLPACQRLRIPPCPSCEAEAAQPGWVPLGHAVEFAYTPSPEHDA